MLFLRTILSGTRGRLLTIRRIEIICCEMQKKLPPAAEGERSQQGGEQGCLVCVGDSGLCQRRAFTPCLPWGPAVLTGVRTSSLAHSYFHTLVHLRLVPFAETQYHSVLFHFYTVLTYSKFMFDLYIISFRSKNSAAQRGG